MIPIVMIGLSIILDGLLTNYLPYLVNSLSYFTPMMTQICLFLVCYFYKKNKKDYLILCLISGIIYDWLYSPFIIFYGIIFLAIGIFSKYIFDNYEISYIKLLFYNILIITIYETLVFLIIIFFNLVNVNLYNLFYKIIHSLILNLIYGQVLYFIIEKIPKKYNKININ